MMDPDFQSIFGALFICPPELFFRKSGLSGLINLKKTPLSTTIPVLPPAHPILHALPAHILQPLHLLGVLSCPSLGWADFTAQARGVWGCVTHGVVPVGCTLPNTWPCCIVTRPCVEAPWNWNSRCYESSGKAWENYKLKGLKFPRLIYPLLFPKINQCPRGFSSPAPD